MASFSSLTTPSRAPPLAAAAAVKNVRFQLPTRLQFPTGKTYAARHPLSLLGTHSRSGQALHRWRRGCSEPKKKGIFPPLPDLNDVHTLFELHGQSSSSIKQQTMSFSFRNDLRIHPLLGLLLLVMMVMNRSLVLKAVWVIPTLLLLSTIPTFISWLRGPHFFKLTPSGQGDFDEAEKKKEEDDIKSGSGGDAATDPVDGDACEEQ